MKGFFVTGTDTEIGKTYSTCLLIKHLASQGFEVGGLKPIASGCEETSEGLRNEDALALRASSNVDLPYSLVNRYRFLPPIAPHIAAKLSHTTINLDLIREDAETAYKHLDYLFIEGVGGWKVPLGGNNTVATLSAHLGLPVIVVVGVKLGCINHALLTIDSLIQAETPLAGWIANVCEPQTEALNENLESLSKMIHAPLIAKIDYKQKELLPKFSYWE